MRMNPSDIRGHLVLLMAPSGSGKGTLITSLGEIREKLYFAKTFTSRQPREGVEENPLYTFISREEFEQMIEEDAFVEWANFSGNYYGTPKSEVLEPLTGGSVVFKEMELQGIIQMRALIPAEHITVIYIDAGDWGSLEKRIRSRASMHEEELLLRKERYEEESKAKEEADIIIKNHDGLLEEAQTHFHEVIENIIMKNN